MRAQGCRPPARNGSRAPSTAPGQARSGHPRRAAVRDAGRRGRWRGSVARTRTNPIRRRRPACHTPASPRRILPRFSGCAVARLLRGLRRTQAVEACECRRRGGVQGMLDDWHGETPHLDSAGDCAQRSRAAKSRRKASRQRLMVRAPWFGPSATPGSGSSVHQFG